MCIITNIFQINLLFLQIFPNKGTDTINLTSLVHQSQLNLLADGCSHQQNVQIVPIFLPVLAISRFPKTWKENMFFFFFYNSVVPEWTLSAGFHEKGHGCLGSRVFAFIGGFTSFQGCPGWENLWKLKCMVTDAHSTRLLFSSNHNFSKLAPPSYSLLLGRVQ